MAFSDTVYLPYFDVVVAPASVLLDSFRICDVNTIIQIGSSIITLLQIYCRIFRWNNFENRLTFDRIMAVRLMYSFLYIAR